MSRRLPSRLLAVLACLGAACTSPATDSGTPPPAPPPPPPASGVATITVTPTVASIAVGQKLSLTAVPKDANGLVLSATFTWQSSNAAAASVDATGLVTGVAAGGAIITASSGTVTSTPAVITVSATAPVIASITLSAATAQLAVGQHVAAVAQAKDANGQAVGATLTWRTSSPSTATVDANGSVAAIAVGTANITASSGTVQSAALVVTVTDNTPWPTTGASTGSAISAAVAQGTLTAEQALVYRMFAAFGDSRLPAAYRGVPDSVPDDAVVLEAADKFSTLSAAAQAQLAPFFVPPPYAGSWYASRVAARGDAGGQRASARAAAVISGSECIFFDWHRTIETSHFTIHYDMLGDALFDPLALQAATMVATEAETVWSKETSTFGRTPLSDATLPAGSSTQCNGGSGKLDIFVENPVMFALSNAGGTLAKTVPYLGTNCQKTPSYIAIPGFPDQAAIRKSLAHEFFHVLELGSYNRAANCISEYYWLGEATGNWAMDLVYPSDQFEQPWAPHYMDGERRVPLDQAYNGDARKTNGYCDYVFLLFLARKYGNSTIKEIWDASEGAKSVTAIVNALNGHGGIKTIWPLFALALWNDVGGNNQSDFNQWDNLKAGMKAAFDDKDAGKPDVFNPPSMKVELTGTGQKTFNLLGETASAGNQIQRLTVYSDYLRFTDQTVSAVLYSNLLASSDFPNLKIQALIKKDGAWQPAADWTKIPYKSFCFDVKNERMDELVLIYSNSDGDPSGQAIPIPVQPRVSVSNVACNQWDGTAQITTNVPGVVQDVKATGLSFKRIVRSSEGVPTGYAEFTPVAGQIQVNVAGQCPTQTAHGPVTNLDADLQVDLDNLDRGLGDQLDRLIRTGSGFTTLSTTYVPCIGPSDTHDASWTWLDITDLTYSVSADGKTITGQYTTLFGPPGYSTTTRWTLTAVKEP